MTALCFAPASLKASGLSFVIVRILIHTGFKLLTWNHAEETSCVLQLAVLTLHQRSHLLPVDFYQVITKAVTLLIYPI